MNFGQRLRELRIEHHMTQDELGRLMNVSKASISLYEKNERTPDQKTLIKTAQYFDVTVDYLLGNSDSRGGSEGVDLDDENPFLSYQGRPVDPDDIELFKQIIRRTRGGDDK